ncbi:hypothetical protein B0H17DRAFT_1020178 [Mycena rosella]|uniref:Oxidase ustYa n=1 Tax=Mycena rosella TaxID=1033263 RepID=A0AAD7G3F3_MYCRO|nr:hypothetical protein B0H17DRAFT_1020178 [Mycena rosella]
MPSQSRVMSVAIILTCLAALVNVYLLATRNVAAPLAATYSYVGDDYPELWPVSLLQEVAMTVEETWSYPIHGDDAQELWATTSSKGFGYVRLGPEHRAFAVAMFHQLHCVRLLRAALDGRYDAVSRGHMHHCLNYIRQMILCSPNLTLEPPDVLSRDFEIGRIGATHVCSDWSAMYRDAAENWAEWFNIVNGTSHS